MKNDAFSRLTEKAISVKLQAMDKVMSKLVEPLSDVGNPEKLIKKPMESWSETDLQLLTKIYGSKEPSPLSELIFRKTYKRVLDLEAAEEEK